MIHIHSSSHGESRIRMLRVVRRGERHDPRALTVSFRFEGDFARAFRDGRADGMLPGEALKSLVHRTVLDAGSDEIESIGLALCDRVLSVHRQVTRARVEIAEDAWRRLEIGGKAQGQAFASAGAERAVAVVTSNGTQSSVISGFDDLVLLRSAGFAPSEDADDGSSDGLQRVLVASLDARWSYSSADVTFRPFRRGVRAALLETFARDARLSVQHTLYAIADVLLASYSEIADVTLALQERPYRPVDLFTAGIENDDELYVAADEPLGVVEVTVRREC